MLPVHMPPCNIAVARQGSTHLSTRADIADGQVSSHDLNLAKSTRYVAIMLGS